MDAVGFLISAIGVSLVYYAVVGRSPFSALSKATNTAAAAAPASASTVASLTSTGQALQGAASGASQGVAQATSASPPVTVASPNYIQNVIATSDPFAPASAIDWTQQQADIWLADPNPPDMRNWTEAQINQWFAQQELSGVF